jgi:hypothetical protein
VLTDIVVLIGGFLQNLVVYDVGQHAVNLLAFSPGLQPGGLP